MMIFTFIQVARIELSKNIGEGGVGVARSRRGMRYREKITTVNISMEKTLEKKSPAEKSPAEKSPREQKSRPHVLAFDVLVRLPHTRSTSPGGISVGTAAGGITEHK